MKKKNIYNGFYLVANYPNSEKFISTALEGLEYFDFLEIGIPFSDPVADGPAIAAAAYQTLEKGFTLKDLFAPLKKIRAGAHPSKKIYFMTYSNIIFQYGVKEFAEFSKENGVSGVIIADIPFIESSFFKKIFAESSVGFIHFISPENTEDQIKEICNAGCEFIYFISVRGITGSKFGIDASIKKKIMYAKKHTELPVVLGFGIKEKSDADEALKYADGFIIGTRIIEIISKNDSIKDYCKVIFDSCK